ncbi:SdiA-regulated domain-containing protein [Mucilaginibacter sp. cycad4]|uniref:SdiA-regulated domain-containing protein n=1 Tax=Mucilaginibacter sp. cycad4 TaxID=3342096 RepID=UPI002AABD1D9|nr:SdiA-regulated domain-containing protein [Mucilaginibacter gossypii]WPV02440.1 SdiA-regulated domain-containing protein [Mucilaginibacter gossypii]
MTGLKKQNVRRKLVVYLTGMLAAAAVFLAISCKNKEKAIPLSPPGYDLNKPVKYKMPDDLTEISGFAFHNGKNDSVYAQQDEEGFLFNLKPGDKKANYTKFAKSGDYEDVAIYREQVIMLKSDGTLFTFPFSQVRTKEVTSVQKTKGELPEGEYEAIYADEKSGLVYVLCKHCAEEKTSKSSSGYIMKLQPDGILKQSGSFMIDVKEIERLTNKKRVPFRPSALAKNTFTNEWYVLSSVNKMLVVTDANWRVKNVYPLSVTIFGQPEGMAFDNQRNLYISNEGDQLSAGNILKFSFKK